MSKLTEGAEISKPLEGTEDAGGMVPGPDGEPLAKAVVLMDGHNNGHHPFFLEMFARSLHPVVDDVYFVGPGGPGVAAKLKAVGEEATVLQVPSFLEGLVRALRWAGCNEGTVFVVGAVLAMRWRLRHLRSSQFVVILPYVYESEFGRLTATVFRGLGIRWGGLCAEGRWVRHPEVFPGEAASDYEAKLERHRAFQRALHRGRVGVWGVLDEEVERVLNDGEDGFLPDKVRAVRIPEIVDGSRNTDPAMIEKIRDWARGRTVVAIAGGLKAGKGLYQFCELAQSAPENYCFVVAGRVFWNSFPSHESKRIREAIMTSKEVLAFLDERLPDSYFNSVLASADLLFMRYRNWTNSSNMLSQAVRFEVPVVVESGFLLADRVKRFRLGIVLEPGQEITNAIPPRGEGLERWRKEGLWQEYRQEHSREQFEEASLEMLRELVPHRGQKS